MKVRVRLHTILRRETPEGIVDTLDLELEPNASVQSVIDHLAIRLKGESILLVVNGQIVEKEQLLAEGDEVRLIPAVSGGCGRPAILGGGNIVAGETDCGDSLP